VDAFGSHKARGVTDISFFGAWFPLDPKVLHCAPVSQGASGESVSDSCGRD